MYRSRGHVNSSPRGCKSTTLKNMI